MSLMKPWDRNIAFFKAENYIKNVKFLKIPDRDRENIIGATTMAAAMFSFSLLSIPVDARPAIEVLHDTTRCVAAYDAAHKAAELTGNNSTAVRFASERKKLESAFGSIGSISLAQ
jgi:hypothetical protein